MAATGWAEAMRAKVRSTLDDFIQREIVGTPDECMRRIAELEASGVNYLRLAFDNEAQQDRVARLVLPKLS